MSIIDTHAHIDQIKDVEHKMSEAYNAGVEAVIAVGIDVESNRRNLKLKEKIHSPKIFTALGIHPETALNPQTDECLKFIRENISRAVAIGEIGLDYWYKWVRKDDDVKRKLRDVYRQQLEMAKSNDLPVIIHSRGAWNDCLDIAIDVGIKKADFHWYSGPVDVLNKILSSGYFISCTPSLAYSPQAKEAVLRAPIELTLIETDSPVIFRESDSNGAVRFSSTPRDVYRTLKLYSDIKGIDEEEALRQLNKNAVDFFGIN